MVGTDPDLGNASNGILVADTPAGSSSLAIIDNNVISDNGDDGVLIEDVAADPGNADGYVVRGTLIGTNASGDADLEYGA